VFDQGIGFFEGTFIEKELNPLSPGQFSLLVLFLNPGLAATTPVGFQAPVQGCENISIHYSPQKDEWPDGH